MAREICISNSETGSENASEKEVKSGLSKKFRPVTERKFELEKLAEEAKKKFGVNVWFAEVLGKRWSFLAGEKDEEFFLPPVKILLCENLGLVVECDDAEVAEKVADYLLSRLDV